MAQGFDVINLHITQKCNLKCKFCFAKFEATHEFDLDSWISVIDRIKSYFDSKGLRGRVNIAGGEPTLVPFLNELIDYIYQNDIVVSVITNGFLLTEELINLWKGKVSMIGVSIDSLNSKTNLKIGRCQGKRTYDYESLVKILSYIKEAGISLKLNTVVSQLNLDEDIVPLYKTVKPDRIKLLQVRVQENCNMSAENLVISEDEFMRYVDKIKCLTDLSIISETADSMESSYVYIDPQGFMMSNQDKKQVKAGNIMDEDLEILLDRTGVNFEKFSERYKGE